MRNMLPLMLAVTSVACGTGGQDAMTLRQKARAANAVEPAPAQSAAQPRITSDGLYPLPDLPPTPAPIASASVPEPTLHPMAGVKVYFKNDAGEVYEFDSSEAEKARLAGLVPASTRDVALAIKAAEKRPGCAMPRGMYSVRYVERDGTCGIRREFIADWRQFSQWQIPPDCKGQLHVSTDGCEISMRYACKKEKFDQTMVMRWNEAGTKATSVEQLHIENTCSGTYNVTYQKL